MSDQVAKRPKMDGGCANELQRKSTSPKQICDLYAQKFSEIVDLEAFVDKTLFIKAFLQANCKVIAVLAPRRFGKSTNMDMVKEFVTGNKKLFEDNRLKIWKEERKFFNKNCQENPVIHVDFKNVGGRTRDEVIRSLGEVIQKAFTDHKYLIKKVGKRYFWSKKLEHMMGLTVQEFMKYCNEPESLCEIDVMHGLTALSRCLNVYHGKRVYVFIDEYDAFIMDAIMNIYPGDKVLNETIDLISGLMYSLLKVNKHIKRGLINARVRVATDWSGEPNNIAYYEFLEEPDFSPYFGFTDKEVNSLFERDEFVTLKNDEVQKWYNGYKPLHTNEYVIYNSYSVLKYLKNSKEHNKPLFESYWVDSESIAKLTELFAETEIRILIENLIDGEEVEIKTIPTFCEQDISTLHSLIHQTLDMLYSDIFLQFLTQNGYFNVVSTGIRTSTILVPNNEIKTLLKEKCYDAELFRNKYQLSIGKIHNYVNALESLLQQRDMNTFITFAKAVSELFDGALMPKCGDEFHSILFTLAYNIKQFAVCSELSVQRRLGKPPCLDILVILSEVVMILELKFEGGTCNLTQGYGTAFNDLQCRNATVKILLGMHMTKERKVALTYTVDNSAEQTVTSDD